MAFFCLCISSNRSIAAISPVNSPDDISGAITINFDGYPDKTVANTLFLDQGVAFTRDDGSAIFLSDWTALERTTTSPNNVLSTELVEDVNTSYATHLNMIFSSPLFDLGAYFGNDQIFSGFPLGDFSSARLSAYDLSDQLLGSVIVGVNHNTSVDQFIGIHSDVPFSRVRFENLSDLGSASQYYNVVVDDLLFAPVPEPSTSCLLFLGLFGFVGLLMRNGRRVS
jgi:hypothetical protein